MDLFQWAKDKARQAVYTVTRKSDAQIAVLEATNDENWGPTNTQMQEICRMCNNFNDCEEIKQTIWERVQQVDTVRYVQKSLILLEFLLRNGPESFRSNARSNLGRLQSLTYIHQYEVGEEAALEAVIRKKAEDIIEMVNDNAVYQEQRERASKLRSTISSASNVSGGYSTYGSAGNTYSSYGGNYESSRYKSSNYGNSSSYGSSNYQNKKQESSDYSDEEQQPAPVAQSSSNNNNEPRRQIRQVNNLNPPIGTRPIGNSQPKRQLQPQQHFDPFGTAPQPTSNTQVQQNFDPFGLSTPQQSNPPPADDLFNWDAPIQQQPQQQPNQINQMNQNNMMYQQPKQQNQQFDFLDFSTPQTQQTQPKQNNNNDDLLMDFGGSNTQQTQPSQQAPPPVQQQKKDLMSEYDGLVNFDLRPQKAYGRAGVQQRGTGTTLGGQ